MELTDATGDRIRELGNEYGAVTGRNRRCGWLDLVALRYAVQVNGVTQLIMMKSDVLSEFPVIKVCTAYTKDGRTLTTVPYDLNGCEAVYEELPGWKTDITVCRTYDALPQTLKDYIAFIERYIGIPITIVSVGPDRNATIVK